MQKLYTGIFNDLGSGIKSFILFALIFSSFIITSLITVVPLRGQTENVGIGTTTPSNSAVLELSIQTLSSPRGFLTPRLTTIQRGNIPGPVPPGLLIYNTDNTRFEFWNGSSWLALIATGFSFSDIGSGTNTSAAMVVGNGASLEPSGTGYITANRFVGSGSTSDNVDLATAEVSGLLPVDKGGTGIGSAPSDGQLLIGNGIGYSQSTLTAGTQISIANTPGSITISSTGEAPLTFDNGLTRTGNDVDLGGSLNQNTSLDIGGNNISISVAGNTGDVIVGKFSSSGFVKSNASGVLSTANIAVGDLPALQDGRIWIGDATNQAAPQSVSGAGTLSNAGVLAINDNAIGGNHINLTGNQNGDLMYYDGTDWLRLPVGSNGQVLKTNAGLPDWGTDDNTTYTAGDGLVLSGTQFSADFAGTGSANTVSRSDHNHTITSNISATAWRIFYSDASGAINELALGSNGSVLQSNGASSAPSWANITLPTGTDGQTLRNNSGVWEANDIIYNDGTNIGIGGITNPIITLHQDAGTATANFHKFTAGTTTGQTVNDGLDVGIDAAGNAYIRQRENLPLIFHTNNTERMRILDDGKIGFGVSSVTAGYNYDFSGNVRIDGDLQVTGEIDPISLTLEPQSSPPSTVTGKMYYNSNDNTLRVWDGSQWVNAFATGSGSLPTGSSGQTLRHDGSDWIASGTIYNAGTNVGIGGISSPAVTMHQDAGDATANFHKFTAGTTTGQDATDGFDVGIDASGNAYIRQRENLPLIFHTNNTERMRILDDGKIGFGVSSVTANYDYEFSGNVRIDGDLQVTGEIDPISLTLEPQYYAPSEATGKMYYDANDNRVKVWDGSQWENLGGGTGSMPTGSSGQTLRHNGSDWVANDVLYNDGTNVGIGTTSPNAKLDINGALAMRRNNVTLGSGNQNNIDIGDYSFIKLSASGNYTITGISGGYDGRMVVLYNNTGYNMGIAHQNTNSDVENRIETMSSGTLTTTNRGSAVLIYDGELQRWLLLSMLL